MRSKSCLSLESSSLTFVDDPFSSSLSFASLGRRSSTICHFDLLIGFSSITVLLLSNTCGGFKKSRYRADQFGLSWNESVSFSHRALLTTLCFSTLFLEMMNHNTGCRVGYFHSGLKSECIKASEARVNPENKSTPFINGVSHCLTSFLF